MVDFEKLNKSKKMNYSIEPIRKILRSEAISDGGTQKKATELEGTWIRVNENEFMLVEENQTTRVFKDENEVGCACDRFRDSGNLLCEHILNFEALKNVPQLSIQSPDCRWLTEYLFSLGWYIQDGWVHPSLDSPTSEPEVVAELPPIEESPKLDPVNEDKPLDTGVDEEPEPKMIERKCDHCGHIEQGEDRDQVVAAIAEHRKTCPKNPANRLKNTPLVTHDAPETKAYACKICGAEFADVDDMLKHLEKCIAEQDMEDTKALMTTDQSSDQSWSDEQIEVMKKTVAEKATPAEFNYFLNVAKYSGLNPFLKEIYFMKTDKGQTAIITGRDGYLTIAKRDPRFMGIHSMEVCENDEFEMAFIDGVMEVSKHNITDFKNRGEIIGAWACGRMNGQDAVTIFASMKEYDKSSNAMGGKIWKQYTSSMIRKVAESMVLKRIAGISGLVTEAEIGGSKLITLDQESG